MGLHLHRAPRTDLLADALGELLATPLDDPFATELVLVPARGVERWLSQRLSHRLGAADPRHDGVCAGVEFRFPRSLVAELTGTRDDDPWAPDALAWPLLGVLDDSLDEPWAGTLAAHLGHHDTGDEAEFRRGRRYSVARRLAGLFASYAAQRPQLLLDWSAGRPTDGLGNDLDGDLAWQPPLWRALCAAVAAPVPAERHATTLARLRAAPSELPPRISLFGHTRMPVTEIELLCALAAHHELHLWLPHPSDDLWRRLADLRGPTPRQHDESHRRVRHPLLASLGRDQRELQRSLLGVGPDGADAEVATTSLPETLLGWLQADLRADAVRPAGRTKADDDRSVQVHRCHGPARQVQVLREVLLGLLEDDPTLEPRDILVMCPDIENYAPLITASFGLGDVVEGGHPAHRLRVQLADRALSQTNPLLGIAAQLLDVAGSRATASAVLDLAQTPPVRRRFGFVDDDLDTLADWVREAGVRWGFDAEHREPFGVRYLQNTWRFGLDRVLTGVALSDDSRAWLGTALPLDDVGSNRVELAGRFAEYLDRLVTATDRLTGTRPLADWLDGLAAGVAGLTRVDRDDQWQVGQVQRELARVGVEAGDRGASPLRLTDVRALLADHLAGRPTRANFRAGSLTVCTMVPMRSVPHRVVCLLGLDDGVFPRQRTVDGDDVLARTPVTGERDVRSEDRQLLLDAVGAATERLVVTYTGADPHSGQDRPPAVPLGELLDALDRTTPAPVRGHVVVKHPLQGFDLRNVEPGRLGTPTPFTFDPQMLAAARVAAAPRPSAPPFLPSPLAEPAAPAAPGELALTDLVSFFRDPVKGFFRALDLTLPWDVDGVSDAMPVEIDQLETWGVGDRMLADMMRGIHPDTAREIEWRRGALPPGQLGWRKASEVREVAMNLAVAALTHRQVPPQALDVDVELPGGRRLTGTVTPVHGDRLVAVGYSRLDGKHLLASWVRLLALAAGRPDHNWTALTIGRAARGAQAAQRLLGPPAEEPRALLAGLVDLYDEGRHAPLQLPLKTSFAWASAAFMGQDPKPEALKKWRSGRFPGEDADAAHVRVWGEHADLERLTDLPALAERLWFPLLASERGGGVTRIRPFALDAPLPEGPTTTVLEASAGTGKTYALAALVTRYVAEGTARLDDMLLITFGRAASQELRERVRDQLVRAAEALDDPARAAASGEQLLRLLVTGSADELAARRLRLRDALAGFDAATIATTHQFCQLVLRSLGVAGDTDAGVTLVENLDDLVSEIVDDLYLQRFGDVKGTPELTRAQALELAHQVVGNPRTLLTPTDPAAGTAAAVRRAFADDVVRELERRKRLLGVLGFDDLLSRLATALEADDAPARDRMRRRWSIVMVDEFQDTDPVQWEVIERAFVGEVTLVLIGDPKQAIYAFRGGDVVTYLRARERADALLTLDTNYRSDAPLVQRLLRVLDGAALGHEEIVVRPVDADRRELRLAGAPCNDPFRLRVVSRDSFGVRGTRTIPMDDLRPFIAADLAADVKALLASEATYDDGAEVRPVRARDVAVIVESHRDARACRDALASAGVPAVYTGDTDVFAAQAAADWQCLLEAFEQPGRAGLVRAAAATMFFGRTATELATDPDLTDQVSDTLRRWADHARARGIAAVLEAAYVAGMAERVLAWRGGERHLTDVEHLTQLLHETAHRDGLGLPALLQWLRNQRQERAGAAERNRRLDSDAAAVQIMTVWVSKGLQYPLVYLPFAFNRNVRMSEAVLYHEPDGTRCLDIGGSAAPGYAAVTTKGRAEMAGDDIRLTYVALTRAQSQVVAWWAPSWDEVNGGLSRLLRGRVPGQAEVPDSLPPKVDDASALERFQKWEAVGGPHLERAEPATDVPEPRPPARPRGLGVRVFDRPIDVDWRRTSYSALIRAVDAAGGVISEPELSARDDELSDELADEAEVAPEPLPDAPPALASPMAGLPSGAAFGSLVHGVLEVTDPFASDLEGELLRHVAEQRVWWPVDTPAEELAAALVPLHHTSLGPLAGGLTLGEIGLPDRLRELDFEIPLAGGDLAAAADVTLSDVGALLTEHLPADDPLRPYAERLRTPGLGGQSLRGYLSGSIDVVLRVPGPRYLVVDYKTNWLGPADQPLTAAAYSRDRLAEAMLHSDYPLQALLYVVVAHRYLRWRQPGYDPAEHLAGVLYLYVRGMCGPETPEDDGHPAGVFSWLPPSPLVTALSDLLDGAS